MEPGSPPSSSSSGASDDEDLVECFPNNPKAYHPGHAINEYMLSSSLDAMVAVTHDDEWISVLKEVCNLGEDEIPNVCELIQRISQQYNSKNSEAGTWLDDNENLDESILNPEEPLTCPNPDGELPAVISGASSSPEYGGLRAIDHTIAPHPGRKSESLRGGMNDGASDIVSRVAALHPREKPNHPGNLFQVASHPAAFHLREKRDPPAHRRPQAIQFPRTLARPPFTDISRDALAAAAPELAAVPTDFIRHGLRAKEPHMQAGIAALAPSHLPASLPRDRLPPALRIPLCAPPPGAPAPPSYPTHALAIGLPVSKSSPSAADAPQAVFPVHAVVLAAHCAKLPRLPRLPPSSRSSSITLPVLPLALPSPQAFAILHAYMYTHRIDAALGALLPLPPAFLASLAAAQDPAVVLAAALAQPSTRHALSVHLLAAAGTSLSALIAHTGHVKELWQDMVALGVYDPALWAAVDLAWEVVLGALNIEGARDAEMARIGHRPR
ncbi:hypothetical protein B0H14DRAFT_2849224 [Mycena olivaceomarginata]|nr:hypothetical protein B0H14DRAFT_2849224 [Mycena olivaceomarginata]